MTWYRAGILVSCVACAQNVESSTSIVTEPVWHLEVENRVVAGEIGPAAMTYLGDAAGELGLSAEEEWAVLSVAAGGDSLAHVRLQELHRGVPVLGSQVAVHADDSTFLAWGGTVTRNLEGFAVEPAVTSDRAMATFEQALAAAAAGPIEYGAEASRLAIQPRAGGGADLVWRLEIFTEGGDRVDPGRWVALIDAISGELIGGWNGLATFDQASGPGGNRSHARSWAAQLDVESFEFQFAMSTDRIETRDMKHGGMFTRGEVVVGPLDPIGDAAINDAHGFSEITLDMMREWMGHDSIDDNGFQIVSRVHYKTGYVGAFWDGDYVNYGDGGGAFYPLSGGIDIVAHEINHGFTQKHSNLEYAGMPGGLNESFSDIAGTLAEFYAESGTADFTVGEDAVVATGYVRNMCDPTIDGVSIDHASKYDPGKTFELPSSATDVHHSSGIGNKAFCLSAARYMAAHATGALQPAVRAVGQAWYLANAGYWTAGASFTQGCQGVVDAARALGFSSQDIVEIHQSWADVGVDCDGGPLVCDSDGTCDVGDGENCFGCASDCGSCSDPCSWFKKAKCRIGIGDCSRCAEQVGCGDGVCGEDETDVSCARDCGCSAPGGSCGSVAPFGCFCDDTCASAGDCCDDITSCQ